MKEGESERKKEFDRERERDGVGKNPQQINKENQEWTVSISIGKPQPP